MAKKARKPTRDLIIEGTTSLFALNGPSGVTLADIARKLKMSNAALLYHFKTPEDLFAEHVDRWAKHGASFTTAYLQKYLGAKPGEIIVGFMEATLALLDEDGVFPQLTLAIFLSAQSSVSVRELLDRVLEGGRGRVRDLLEREHPGKQKDLIEKIAAYLHAQVVGALVYEMVFHRSPKDKKAWRAYQIEQFKRAVQTSLEDLESGKVRARL